MEMGDPYSVSLLRARLPSDVNVSELVNSLSYKWFGNLRWLGSTQAPDSATLSWMTNDSGLKISIRIKEDVLTIETFPLGSNSVSDAARSAFELFDHVSKALKGSTRSSRLKHQCACWLACDLLTRQLVNNYRSFPILILTKKDIQNMTTIVGINCKDGVVLSSDKRASKGFFIGSKETQKILPVDETIAVAIAGQVSDAEYLVNAVRAERKLVTLQRGFPLTVKETSKLIANIAYNGMKNYQPYYAEFIVAGVDQTGPHVFISDMSGAVSPEEYVSTGSGSPIAYGVLESSYHKDLDDGRGKENRNFGGQSSNGKRSGIRKRH